MLPRRSNIETGIATSHRELFHSPGGRRLLISNFLEPTHWLDYKSAFRSRLRTRELTSDRRSRLRSVLQQAIVVTHPTPSE
jgi:hypothetical protein